LTEEAVTDLLDFDTTSKWVEGDVRLHYHEAGSGPTLVCLHGSGPGVSAWSNFRGNLPVFADHFRTILLDMPGFGLSGHPAFDDIYPRVAAAAVRRFVDSLGLGPIHLLGNSMGGYVATEFTLANPDLVGRLVLMGPGGLEVSTFAPSPSEGWKRLSEFLENPTRDGMVAWVDCMVANRSVVSDELIDERMTNALKPGAIDRAKEIFGTFAKFPINDPPWTRAHLLANPTLVTWGRDDRMVLFEGGLMPYRRLPNAELHVFSNCGHWAQVERKKEFERLVIEFLTRDENS
jgi:4,5:9,10-diseco-3-hydroxy-5,9,17-trioxoandrosta-1(10),2-diene-4-oate hydrolase